MRNPFTTNTGRGGFVFVTSVVAAAVLAFWLQRLALLLPLILLFGACATLYSILWVLGYTKL